jgi:hypothetical protein
MRLRIHALAALVCLGLAGCTSHRLRERTVRQGATLPELQYQQVLDNLARFAADPAALPWHVNLREGTTQLTDSASGGVAIDLGPPTDYLPQLFGSRTAVAQWGMTPVIDPLALRLLRIAYRRAHGAPEMPSPELLDELAHELKNQVPLNPDLRDETELFFEYQYRAQDDAAALDAHVVTTNDESFIDGRHPREAASPLARDVARQVASIERALIRIGPGWFRVGRKRDVPKDACYVGHHGECYVWVEAGGREALTEFTLTVLRFSSLIKETQTLVSPGSVKFSPGDRG